MASVDAGNDTFLNDSDVVGNVSIFNDSDSTNDMERSRKNLLGYIQIAVALLMIICNLFIICVILASRALRNSSKHFLILNLGFVDILKAVALGIYIYMNLAESPVYECDLDYISLLIRDLTTGLSGFFIFLINIDYVATANDSKCYSGRRLVGPVLLTFFNYIITGALLVPLLVLHIKPENFIGTPVSSNCWIFNKDATFLVYEALSVIPQTFFIVVSGGMAIGACLARSSLLNISEETNLVRRPIDLNFAGFLTVVLHIIPYVYTLILKFIVNCGICSPYSIVYLIIPLLPFIKCVLLPFVWLLCADVRAALVIMCSRKKPAGNSIEEPVPSKDIEEPSPKNNTKLFVNVENPTSQTSIETPVDNTKPYINGRNADQSVDPDEINYEPKFGKSVDDDCTVTNTESNASDERPLEPERMTQGPPPNNEPVSVIPVIENIQNEPTEPVAIKNQEPEGDKPVPDIDYSVTGNEDDYPPTKDDFEEPIPESRQNTEFREPVQYPGFQHPDLSYGFVPQNVHEPEREPELDNGVVESDEENMDDWNLSKGQPVAAGSPPVPSALGSNDGEEDVDDWNSSKDPHAESSQPVSPQPGDSDVNMDDWDLSKTRPAEFSPPRPPPLDESGVEEEGNMDDWNLDRGQPDSPVSESPASNNLPPPLIPVPPAPPAPAPLDNNVPPPPPAPEPPANSSPPPPVPPPSNDPPAPPPLGGLKPFEPSEEIML